jgi:hypothetical protein
MGIQELCGRLDRVGRGITQLESQLADEGALTLLKVVYVVGEQTLGCRTPVEVSPVRRAPWLGIMITAALRLSTQKDAARTVSPSGGGCVRRGRRTTVP